MITIPEIVEKIVRNSTFLEEGLNKKIINLSALSRIIKPEIEKELYKKVKNGAINPATGYSYKPWDLVPTVFNFDLPFAPSEKIIVGATYDPTKRIIYVAQKFGDSTLPLIHAFQLPISIQPPSNLKVTLPR